MYTKFITRKRRKNRGRNQKKNKRSLNNKRKVEKRQVHHS